MASFFTRTKSISRRERSETTSSPVSATSPVPPSNILVNAYRSTFGTPSTPKTPGGVNSQRTAVDDPVSMHLLMETAMHDSSSFVVLAPEEADALKRQLDVLAARIEATHRNLALQTRVRDAATAVGKLDGGGQESTEEGREAAAKCEELGRELWEMEKEQTRLQRKLLEHTAGVLQMTHKGYTKDMSVASLTMGSSLPDEDFDAFDMNSGLYKPYMGDFEDGIIEIGGTGMGDGGEGMSKEQKQIIENVEAKAERLNGGLRDLMSRLDQRAPPPAQARSLRDDPSNPIEILLEQMNALEQSVAAIQEVQARQLHFINRQVYEAITGDSTGAASPTYAAPPQEDDIATQYAYLANGVGKVKHMINHMESTVSNSGQKMEDLEQYNSVLTGLWELLNTDEGGRISKTSFSLSAFNTRVQATHNKVGALEQQKEVLTRQIQQQRELNASSDEVKDRRIAEMSEKMRRIPQLEEHTQHLEGEVARLQTELTMARADLDGAYGTRAQRKAEAAADPTLTNRVTTLERELAETIADYEAMTKATIEHEKEREQLEATVDGQRDKIEQLETALSEERIHSLGGGLGSRTPATPATEAGGRGGTSASVLRAEFKKMMKDTKTEHAKRVREEQEERRRLEGIIRGLKKEQLGPRAQKTAAAGAA